jgi:hypothetical protein
MTHIGSSIYKPYEEIHLHSGWGRVVARGLRTKNRDSESAGWGKEGNEHHDRESFAGHNKQDGDKYDDQYDVFAGCLGNSVISEAVLRGLPWRSSGKTFAVRIKPSSRAEVEGSRCEA